jgi:hypothetical protein
VKANKITNSINILLNEDKFSKYSMQQVYDELGKEDFIEYLKNICNKVVKNLDTETNIKKAEPSASKSLHGFSYSATTGNLKEFISIYIGNWNEELQISYEVIGAKEISDSIEWDEKDISQFIKASLNLMYNSDEASLARQSILSAVTNKTPVSEYSNYSFEQLLMGLTKDKLVSYIISCMEAALRSVYKPTPNSGVDLRKKQPVFVKDRRGSYVVCQLQHFTGVGVNVDENLLFSYYTDKRGRITFEPSLSYTFQFSEKGNNTSYRTSNASYHFDSRAKNLEQSITTVLKRNLEDNNVVEIKKLFQAELIKP